MSRQTVNLDSRCMDEHSQPPAPRSWLAAPRGFLPARRSLLQAALLAPWLGLAACSDRPEAVPPHGSHLALPRFFTDAERRFVDAATARLIPDGEDGLGARGAAVTFFIDRQLAGKFGQAADWYMQGPWADGMPGQGYQSRLTPAQVYRAAIGAIEARCQQAHGGQRFAELAGAQQDEWLTTLEHGQVKLDGVDAKTFFQLLLQNTKEGFLSDPMYGGNRGFAGWRLIGFPGPRYNYVADITRYGRRYPLPTVGLLGRDGSLIRIAPAT